MTFCEKGGGGGGGTTDFAYAHGGGKAVGSRWRLGCWSFAAHEGEKRRPTMLAAVPEL